MTANDPHIDLRWIEEDSHAERPIFQHLDPEDDRTAVRSFKSVLWNRCKDNIFVPLGLIATTACLTLGLVNMRRGNSKQQQLFMRGRVAFQGFTLAAMVIGVTLTAKQTERRRAERRLKNELDKAK